MAKVRDGNVRRGSKADEHDGDVENSESGDHSAPVERRPHAFEMRVSAPWDMNLQQVLLNDSENVDDAVRIVEKRSRVHEEWIRQDARTKRLALIIGAVLFVTGCQVIVFAPSGRETVAAIVGAAMLVVAAGTAGYRRVWGRAPGISVGAGDPAEMADIAAEVLRAERQVRTRERFASLRDAALRDAALRDAARDGSQTPAAIQIGATVSVLRATPSSQRSVPQSWLCQRRRGSARRRVALRRQSAISPAPRVRAATFSGPRHDRLAIQRYAPHQSVSGQIQRSSVHSISPFVKARRRIRSSDPRRDPRQLLPNDLGDPTCSDLGPTLRCHSCLRAWSGWNQRTTK